MTETAASMPVPMIPDVPPEEIAEGVHVLPRPPHQPGPERRHRRRRAGGARGRHRHGRDERPPRARRGAPAPPASGRSSHSTLPSRARLGRAGLPRRGDVPLQRRAAGGFVEKFEPFVEALQHVQPGDRGILAEVELTPGPPPIATRLESTWAVSPSSSHPSARRTLAATRPSPARARRPLRRRQYCRRN